MRSKTTQQTDKAPRQPIATETITQAIGFNERNAIQVITRMPSIEPNPMVPTSLVDCSAAAAAYRITPADKTSTPGTALRALCLAFSSSGTIACWAAVEKAATRNVNGKTTYSRRTSLIDNRPSRGRTVVSWARAWDHSPNKLNGSSCQGLRIEPPNGL